MNFKLNKQFTNRRDLLIAVALIVGILAVANWLSYRWFIRQDLTAGGLYSISPATKRIVKNLPDVVNVKVYFSKNLPSQFIPVRQQLVDILSDYHSYSSNFKVEYIDPKDGQEAEAVGIPKLQFNDYSQDKLEVVAGYMGLVINYHDQSEVMPVVQDTANFEYDLSSRLKKLTSPLPAIGFVTGHGSAELSGQMPRANQELAKTYNLRSINLNSPIPDDIKILVLAAPKENLAEGELKKIDEFLMEGNSAIFLVDGVNVDAQMSASANKINVLDFLAKYGIKVNNNLVLDASAGVVSFSQGIVSFTLPYPYWPRLVNQNFDQNNPLVAGLEGVVLPWASSIDIDQSKIDPSAKISYLAKSSQQALVKDKDWDLQPNRPFSLSKGARQYNLAVSVSGQIKSSYGEQTTDNGRIFVVGDGDFMQDNFSGGSGVNLVFLQNIFDGAGLDSDLAGIRSKRLTSRSLNDMPQSAKDGWRYLNVFGVTVVVLVFGLLRYWLRKKTKTIEI
jgi:gliding-associated putative ABC transporter substrate-binding component GldG